MRDECDNIITYNFAATETSCCSENIEFIALALQSAHCTNPCG